MAIAGEFERAGEERVVLDSLEFLEPRDVDECVRGANDAAHVLGEVHGVHAVVGREAHRAPDVFRETLGLGFESTLESHKLVLIGEESVMHFLEKFGEKRRRLGPEGRSRAEVTGNRDLLGLCELIVELAHDPGDSSRGIGRECGVSA